MMESVAVLPVEQSVEQWCDSILSVRILENQSTFFSDSPFFHPEVSPELLGKMGEYLPHWFRMDDALSLFLLLVLFLSVLLLAGTKRLMIHQIKRFFAPMRDQANLFDGDTKGERRCQRLLTGLNILLPALLLCTYVVCQDSLFSTESYSYLFLAVSMLFFGLYYFLKLSITSVVDWTFFDKKQRVACSEVRRLLYAIQGIGFFPLLFLPIYFECSVRELLLYLFILVVFVKILLLYKYWTIFFSKTYGLLHFIAYFCALEIIPVLVLWRILAFVNYSFI